MARTDRDHPRFPRRLYYTPPPRQFILDFWTSRERQRVRVECLNAAKEHRATRTADTVPSVDQHRQCAQWVWS